jgi:p-hydroxybenzoate 3-monooxygenase
MRTRVGIVGAGPAGLLLSHLLHRAGIDSVVLEIQSRACVEQREQAGVLEPGTIEVLNGSGVGERARRRGLLHHGIELRFGGRRHRVPFEELVPGRAITIYGRQEVVKDLIAARLDAGGEILFEVKDVVLHDIDSDEPAITFTYEGAPVRLECVVIAGCDGPHGICLPSIPESALTVYAQEYPFVWLSVLAAVVPSTTELIYAQHHRGFALHSMRSPTISQFHMQVPPNEDIAAWPDERIWSELKTRLETVPDFRLETGPVLEKEITPIRGFVAEPMRYGRLYLAGDSAHVVPPIGAKGLNLAIADVTVLAEALASWFTSGDTVLLDAYSDTRLRRVWRAQHFSWWMLTMLHRFDTDDDFRRRLRRAHLEYVATSRAAATMLAENYVGLPFS